MESIGGYSFYACSSLHSVDFPGNVEIIGEYAFMYCSNLNLLRIDEGVEIIGDAAFYYCESLTDIVIPESVQYIGNSAFEWLIFHMDGKEVKSDAEHLAGREWTGSCDRNLYGQSDDSYCVYFDPQDGFCPTIKMFTGDDGTLPSIPEAEMEGCTFTGWFTESSGGSQVTRSTLFAEDSVVFAHWEDISS